MLSIEIKVNGVPCIVINSNRGLTMYEHGEQRSDYPYRGISFPISHGDPTVFTGTVEEHGFKDGLMELSRRILECACDETVLDKQNSRKP